jgi:hypothetical protein
MENAVERIMRALALIVNLTPAQERSARDRVTSFLTTQSQTDEEALAVEGLRYLRQDHALPPGLVAHLELRLGCTEDNWVGRA